MIKKVIEKYIQKNKNKNFVFDPALSNSTLLSFFTMKFVSLVRGYKFFYFSQRGKFLFFGKRVQLFNRSNMVFGNNVNISDYVRLSGLGKGKLKIGDNVSIGSFSQLIVSTSFNNIGEHIIIGDNVGMGEFAYIGGGGGSIIGKDTIIGQYFSMHPENHNFSDASQLIREQGVDRIGVEVGENCWIGSKVTILDGVKIGDNCVIAAGSVVTNSFSKNSLIGGVPAKLLKSL